MAYVKRPLKITAQVDNVVKKAYEILGFTIWALNTHAVRLCSDSINHWTDL